VSARKKPWGTPVFRIERFDYSWGGWRAVPESDVSDEPAKFETAVEAEQVCNSLRGASAYAYRVVEVYL
jgi:hypothetical protein